MLLHFCRVEIYKEKWNIAPESPEMCADNWISRECLEKVFCENLVLCVYSRFEDSRYFKNLARKKLTQIENTLNHELYKNHIKIV